jgi:hypothetical protein
VKIERGIARPTGRTANLNEDRLPFAKMKVSVGRSTDQSFWAPVNASNLSAYAIYVAKKHGLKYKFTVRSEMRNGTLGTRIWRIK